MKKPSFVLFLLLIPLFLCACEENGFAPAPSATTLPSRQSKIPPDAVKMGPETDAHPPILHHPGWRQPQPLPGPINTAGGEDSPFITGDGMTFMFFFTPDVAVPHEKQLLDGVTGLYQSRNLNGGWSDPERVLLNDDLALDGCPFILDQTLWFCSTRAGYSGVHWFTAQLQDGRWTAWQEVEFDPSYQVGELHISSDRSALYFHSNRAGTKGANDIWVSRKADGGWDKPENLAAVNSAQDDSRPYLTPDGQELWFTRTHQGTPAIFRARRGDSGWQEPEIIISQFAGEPTLDPEGNIYFVHHFFQEGEMIEVDIYVAYKK